MKYSSLYATLKLFACFFVCFSCITESRVIETETEERVYVINNDEFGIRSDRTGARATNDGLNAALKQAKKEGYRTVKLTPGDYLLVASGRGYENHGGIFVPSDITFDLTGARLYVEPNAYTEYSLIRLDMVENVTVFGGHLTGDKNEHDYETNPGTHEFGSGIIILSSKNITIRDMRIEQMTGDAIGMGSVASPGGPNERRMNDNVKILNCDMSHCRRQGISIGHSKNVEIAHNKIYNITGTPPGCGIDIEPGGSNPGEPFWTEYVRDVFIHHNEFRDTWQEGLCIVNSSTSDIEASDNYFENSGIVINRSPARIRLLRNTLKGGYQSYMVALKNTIDVYMPLEGPNKNVLEYPTTVYNCSTQTGYIKETDNYTKCD
ncbi:MAG: right-handed parallel beta-helix repeat-containing protein [Tannerella sp.]|nr:right-handed parallel beta-helix repeat-containing protein [Tannerella sp.]